MKLWIRALIGLDLCSGNYVGIQNDWMLGKKDGCWRSRIKVAGRSIEVALLLIVRPV